MALTITAAINAQSIGTSTNIGNSKFPTKVTLQAATTAFAVEASVTNGAGAAFNPRQKLDVRFAVSSFSLTDTAAPDILGQASNLLQVTPSEKGGEQRINVSELQPTPGGYFYVWLDVPVLPAASTVTVNLIEW